MASSSLFNRLYTDAEDNLTESVRALCDLAVARKALCEFRAEIARLRDVVRLLIGYSRDVPWRDVPQSDVDGWLKELKRLKAFSAEQAIESLRQAGGKGWDDIDNPQEFLGRST